MGASYNARLESTGHALLRATRLNELLEVRKVVLDGATVRTESGSGLLQPSLGPPIELTANDVAGHPLIRA